MIDMKIIYAINTIVIKRVKLNKLNDIKVENMKIINEIKEDIKELEKQTIANHKAIDLLKKKLKDLEFINNKIKKQ